VRHILFISVVAFPVVAMAGQYEPAPAPVKVVASPTATATAHQSQMQRQVQRQRVVTNNNVTVTAPAATAATAPAGSGAVPVIGGGGGVTLQAPSFSLPSVGASGMDCPTVGFSAGGSGPMGGGGLGPSWISRKCDARKLAELLYNMGHPDIAMKVLADEYDVVADAVKAGVAPSSPPEKQLSSTLVGVRGADSLCAGYKGWSPAERSRYASVCR
jgi:hypothetical protein